MNHKLGIGSFNFATKLEGLLLQGDDFRVLALVLQDPCEAVHGIKRLAVFEPEDTTTAFDGLAVHLLRPGETALDAENPAPV